MSRIDWQEAYGPASDSLRTLVADALQQEALPMKRKHISAALVAAIILALLAATALAAVTLIKSPEYQATSRAKEAMYARGFTYDTLGFFIQDVEENKDGWTIRFLPIKYALQAGNYTVEVPAEGDATAIWLYDDAVPNIETLQGKKLDADFWGPEQIALQLETETAYQAASGALINKKPDMETWTLEDMAIRDAPYVDSGLAEAYGTTVSILPTAQDIQPEEAMRIAKDAVWEKYGIDDAYLDALVQITCFQKTADVASPEYRIYFNDAAPYYGGLTVVIASPDGEIRECSWYPSAERHVLPEGPLEAYPQAVAEYMERGVFDMLSHAEKAKIAARLHDGGYGALVHNFTYLNPEDTGYPEDAARNAADIAIDEKYGITASIRPLFEVSASHIEANGKPVWVVDYSPTVEKSMASWYPDKIGTYRVVVDAETNAVQRTSWSNDTHAHVETSSGNWGGAWIWDASVLPYLMALEDALSSVYAKYEGDNKKPWTLEDAAKVDQLYRDAGFDVRVYTSCLPMEGDIAEAGARAIAEEALQSAYELPSTAWKRYRVSCSFHMLENGDRAWRYALFSETAVNDEYYVSISATTGELLNVEHVTSGNG